MLAFGLSILGTVAALIFFYCVAQKVGRIAFKEKGELIPICISLGMVALIFWEGFRRTRSGNALYGFHDSALNLGLDSSTAGSMLVSMEAAQVTGPAYVLTQIFLCGPVQWSKTHQLLASRILPEDGVAKELSDLLVKVEKNARWHPAEFYAEHSERLAQLILMEKIEFSPRKGLVKPKTKPD